MLHSFISLLPAAVGASRFRRGAKKHNDKPAENSPCHWIWLADAEPVVNSYIRARRKFSLPAAPKSASLKISANSLYKLYINGQYVGKGPVRSGEGQCYFDTFQIGELLHKGDNVIAVLAHHIGKDTFAASAGRPGLICKVKVELADEALSIVTDETWKMQRAEEWVADGARMNHRLGFQESYNAALVDNAWREIKFREKGWEAAAVVATPPALPFGKLLARQIPQLNERTILPAAIVAIGNTPDLEKDIPITEMPAIMAAAEMANLRAGQVKDESALLTADGVAHIKTPRGGRGVAILLDFGREVFGNVEIGIAGSGTGCIDLCYCEELVDGRIKPDAQETLCTDRLLLRRGALEWQSFQPRAFRFLQIEFRRCSKPVALQYVRVNQTTYPIQPAASFKCNDRLITEIWEAGAYTAELCMQDTFIDCPLRERAQWWSEARLLSRTAYYAFGDTALLAQALRQFAASQDKDGTVLALYPAGVEMLAPDLALLWIYSILDYYAFSDDAELVEELYPTVEKLLSWFGRYINDSGLLADVPGHLQVDHADLEREGEVTALNCFYYQGLRVAAALASICGKEEDAERYISAAHNLKVALNKYLYVPRNGLFAECRVDGQLVEKFSAQANILAALFDVTDQYQKAGIMRQIHTLPELTTPYFASYYLEALYLLDRHDEALAYMRRTWGQMIKAGATTLWEDFDTRGCLCHGSAVAPTRDLIAEYVGIKPVAGAHRFVVTPHTGDLKWAHGTFNTQNGPLSVKWRIVRNGMEVTVDVPEGVRVDVYPPGPVGSSVTINGKPTPTRFASVTHGAHVIRLSYPKPPKPVDYDAAPAPLIPQVQVLENDFKFGRRRIESEPKRKSKHSTKPEEPLEVKIDTAEIIEPQAIDLLPKTESEETSPETPEVAEPKHTKKHRRKPRSRGHKKSHAESTVEEPSEAQTPLEAETPIAEEPDPTAEQIDTSAEPVAEQPADESPAPKPRRRPRGGRGHRKPRTESQETDKSAEPEAAESSAPVVESSEPVAATPDIEAEAESAPAEPKPKRRRRTYTRRKKSNHNDNPPDHTEQSADVTQD